MDDETWAKVLQFRQELELEAAKPLKESKSKKK
jgi:hypothetical protein